ncbi:hypothetical protein Ancab_029406 [Ancistrocladus abbreviatus]
MFVDDLLLSSGALEQEMEFLKNIVLNQRIKQISTISQPLHDERAWVTCFSLFVASWAYGGENLENIGRLEHEELFVGRPCNLNQMSPSIFLSRVASARLAEKRCALHNQGIGKPWVLQVFQI